MEMRPGYSTGGEGGRRVQLRSASKSTYTTEKLVCAVSDSPADPRYLPVHEGQDCTFKLSLARERRDDLKRPFLSRSMTCVRHFTSSYSARSGQLLERVRSVRLLVISRSIGRRQRNKLHRDRRDEPQERQP